MSLPRSSSTFNVSGGGRNAVVQRSNSLDPSPRPRVSICIRAPSSPDRAPYSTAPPPATPTVTLAPPPVACRGPAPPADPRKTSAAPRRETLL
ncbi:uncharacterized protein LOC133126880 [Conger conger]|uniref:uncharacterized protein LOC133126880 n=1 Tax=Conger conger TaxID=82655 RepID=UPI002A5A5448|nr:uncharacterized protein LOC133126880 [Conger conger]